MKRRTGRNRLFVIDKKTIKIAAIILTAIIAIVVIAVFVSSGKKTAEKHEAVEKLISVGVVNVGLRSDLGTLCMYDSKTKTYTGLEKDISDEILKRLFNGKIIIRYVDVDSETKDSLLVTGDADMSFGASINASTSGIDYSNTYFSDGSAFLVRNGEFTDQSQLNGATIAVVQGSLEATKIGKKTETMNIEVYLKSHNINANVKKYASYPEAVEALRVKFITAVCAPETFLKIFGKSGMVILPERFLPNDYCIETRSSLGGLVDSVNDKLNAMKKDGTLDSLLKKWNFTDYSKNKK